MNSDKRLSSLNLGTVGILVPNVAVSRDVRANHDLMRETEESSITGYCSFRLVSLLG